VLGEKKRMPAVWRRTHGETKKEDRCTVEKKEYEETLAAEAKYTCPHCGNQGESTAPFKRKKIKGVDTLRIQCQHCGGNIDITKKMTAKK